MVLDINNVWTYVSIGGADYLGSFNIEKELDAYLTVAVDGAYWARKRAGKAGKKMAWDGKQHYYKGGKFPTGFLSLVIKWCKSNDLVVKVIDNRRNLPVFRSELRTFFGEKTLRGYQLDAVQKVNKHITLPDNTELFYPRGIVNAATNSGKGLIMLGIVDNIVDVKCLLLIHNQEIFEQLVEVFEPFYEVGRITSKECIIRPVTIAMVKSLLNKIEKSLDLAVKLKTYFNLLLVDECHRAGALEYQKVFRYCDIGGIVFVSGTALDNDDKVANLNIIAMSGEVIKVITNTEMFDEQVSAVPTVHIYLVPYTVRERLNLAWRDVETYNLFLSLSRIDTLIDVLIPKLAEGKQVLVTFIKLVHGEFMLKRINERVQGFVVDMVHGKDPDRAYKLQAYKDNRIQLMLVSLIFKEGINMPNIDVLGLMHGGKSKITVKQFIGRLIRITETKRTVEVLDLYDNCNYLEEHSRKRIAMYKKEGFKIVVHYEHKNYKPCKK